MRNAELGPDQRRSSAGFTQSMVERQHTDLSAGRQSTRGAERGPTSAYVLRMPALLARTKTLLVLLGLASVGAGCASADAGVSDDQNLTESGRTKCPTDRAELDALLRIPQVAASCDAIAPPPTVLRPFKSS